MVVRGGQFVLVFGVMVDIFGSLGVLEAQDLKKEF